MLFEGGGGGGGGEEPERRLEGAIVHKAGSKIPTCLTVSPVYNLQSLVKATFSFGVFIVY
jgi:hypothetical protein